MSENISDKFAELMEQWYRESGGISPIYEMSPCPSYQQIIEMGNAAIPFLLREVEKGIGHWFWALKAIANEDPVPPDVDRKRDKKMRKLWLEWGIAKGYKW